ncbi:DEAD/DEAH box helicase family protein [Leptolinea tardivitalis]|uniref:Restriction endonuclease subunit R n=1 Tax=Leptolinea tardivitalis TaxID=229920 RepID=A0A0P6X3K8_9CHLR|nr:DEAD/DEAH box helicase family protein [Leptolinea tardivitalis]KPL74000.1 restriction endonuclease subunit R [Leptolinea tardivitalis]GAP22633.1 restriction endonuclease [Leptolinea tardivitalis]
MTDTINTNALEPLHKPWQEPTSHRVRAEQGQPSRVEKGRRPSPLPIVQNLRLLTSEWRKAEYPGVSQTSRELLFHWFWSDHRITTPDGQTYPFNYYFCQREAIETLIYLREVRGITSLSSLIGEFFSLDGNQETSENAAQIAAAGITPDEDRWPRYAFKVATGAGKTKIMSLALVWSYFHALRESDSDMARHFVIIAPNLTVFERLKMDFAEGKIFDQDPLIPPAWLGDWNMTTVLQDEASGSATGGVLYLTNIHRLFAPRKTTRGDDYYDWAGPTVSRARALETGAELRARISAHPKIMVMNDEAHHVWDPDSAWNEALFTLDESVRMHGTGITAQLDFSATPKDNKGNLFKHIICDTPLGEAVESGIVKTPIIGRGQNLHERADEAADRRFEEHLMLGYQRWLKSREEWEHSGKKALLFVMTEDTKSADEITRRLNTDPQFRELNKKTINLHTNLKGQLKKRGRGEEAYYEFEINEKEISDDDLKALRQLSRELDSDTSPYCCIVSVLMLREGWDVRNVTTIVPLRPYSSKANILPEQTLGRGLRRMTLPGQALETVTVVEHEAFTKMYQEQLDQEGLPIEIVDTDQVPRTTVSIFPDELNKDLQALNIILPGISPAYTIINNLDGLSYEEIKAASARYPKLLFSGLRREEIEYEGRSLITNEIVEQMKFKLPLLQSGIGAVAFYREELEHACGLSGTHQVLAPLIQQYLENDLFESKTTLFDPKLIARLGDDDVREYIRAVFLPVLRAKTTMTEERVAGGQQQPVINWRPFQVTSSELHPTLLAARTPFNLVPCNRQLEVAFARFADRSEDVAAFSKNAGPQALRIDYLASGNRLAFYTPDFFVRLTDGNYLLVETKGREDAEVPNKVRAAVSWCKSASTGRTKWNYLYIPEGVFQNLHGSTMAMLVNACEPTLRYLLAEVQTLQPELPFYEVSIARREEAVDLYIDRDTLESLPSRYRKAIEESVALLTFLENKGGSLSPCFTTLLGVMDDAAKSMVITLLEPLIPEKQVDQQDFFDPPFLLVSEKEKDWMRKNAAGLKKGLVYKAFIMPLGQLGFCLEYAKTAKDKTGGLYEAIRTQFSQFNESQLGERLDHIRTFRNTYIAHQEKELTESALAKQEMKNWITGLAAIYTAIHS